MPGAPVTEDIELIIDDIGGGRGKEPPSDGDGADDGKRHRPPASPRPYYTAIALAIISILMFFTVLTIAYLLRRGSGSDWIRLRLPAVLWANTAVLLASSWTMELARRRLKNSNLNGFRNWWQVTTALGLFFLAGQVVAWKQLVSEGVYVATNAASGFFYIFTAAHGLHLLGGVCALLYVLMRNFDNAKISRAIAAEVSSYYWHFLDGLWIFLVALLYLRN
jgi:cytochrome c oxidase subunit 3